MNVTTQAVCRAAPLRAGLLAAAVVAIACLPDRESSADAPPPVSYTRQVRPILQARCQGCHQPAKDEGGYVMTDVARMRSAGDSGLAGIVPGKPDESHLVSQITPDAAGIAEMPDDGKPLSAAEIDLVRRWIAEGAKDDAPVSAGQQVDADHPPRYTRQPVVTALDFSPDGSLLAVTGFHEVLVFDLGGSTPAAAPPRLKMRLVGLAERVERVRFSPDGTKLAVTGGNPARLGEIQIWSVADGSLLRSVPVSFDTVYGGCWSPDGTKIAFGCTDNTVRAIDAETGVQVLQQGAHEDWVLDTVFSQKGDHVVSVGRDMTVKLTEFATQRFIDNITSITPGALRGGLAAVDRHPTLEHVVVAGADGTPRAYRIHRHAKRQIGDDANLIFPLHAVNGRVFSVRFSPDGRRVAAAGGLDGRGELVVASYDLAEDVPRKILDIMAKVPGESRQNGSQRSKEEWQAIDDYRDASTKLLCRVETPAAAYATAFHPRSGDVAVAGGDGIVRFFDPATGAARGSFPAATIEAARAGGAALPLPWPAEPSIEPEPAADGPVASLAVEPESIALDGPFAATQLVVVGTLADGRTLDLTRSVRFESAGDGPDARSLVAIGPGGLARPLADGVASLRVVHGAAEATVVGTIPVRVAGVGKTPDVDFIRDVNPVLAKMGCNQGTCHGAAKGKNGFKLSLRGYDPIFDLRSLTDDHGSRRVNLASPDDSLMLLKASATAPHTGGLLAKPEESHYQIVRRWIEQGARLDLAAARVRGIRVFPPAAVVDAPGRRQQFRVVADYADGTSRDVTRQAFLESGNNEVATADPTGLVTAVRRGEAPILVRYEGSYAAVTLTVMGDRSGFEWAQPESWGTVDDLVADKWRSMKILPAPLSSDADFLRRVTLDLTGLPPTAGDVRRFLADTRDTRTKRVEAVRRLIGSDAFVEHWTNKWADLLQVNPKFLAPEGARGLRDWIRRQVADNVPHDRFVREILTAAGSNREHPAAAYFKTLRDPLLTMENTTHLFLGIRFNCNKCHDHPFERWTQDQYYETAAFFAQVRLVKDPESKNRTIGGSAVDNPKPLWEVVTDAADGEVKHERTGRDVPPRFPFECRNDAPPNATRRQRLAAWITSPDNAYFARSHVNRLWGYLFGTGIIDPIDDIRAGNPPTNPALLEHLTRSFIDGGFDTRKVLAEICTSRTYGLSIDSGRWNEDDRINYSHALPRRLPAETLFDALHAVIGSPSKFPGLPVGTRAAQLTDVSSTFGKGFLATFGRPVRESACECERAGGVALGPVMALASGPAVGDVLADPQSELAKLVAAEPDDAALVDEVFLRVLNRPSRPEEAAAARALVAEIAADHVALTADLAAAEAAWATRRQALEAERLRRIEERRVALAQTIAAHEPVRLKREQERAERIAETIAGIERYHGDPAGRLSGFEAVAKNEPRWQILRPTKVTSSSGARTDVLADGSVLAVGGEGDEYMEVRAPIDLKSVTAIRLEVIPDPSLPGGGSGRAPDGSFVLTEIGLSIAPASRPTDTQYVTLSSGVSDFAQDPLRHPSKAINNDDSSRTEGWAVSPRQREPHWAVFQATDATGFREPMVAVFRIVNVFQGGRHSMGRFRISCTDATGPISLGVPARAVELVAIPREKRTPAEATELEAMIAALDPRRSTLSAELAAAARPLPPEPKLVAAAADLAEAQRPLAEDPAIVRLRADHAESTRQVANSRLTAFQDLAWALINSPAFFFNR